MSLRTSSSRGLRLASVAAALVALNAAAARGASSLRTIPVGTGPQGAAANFRTHTLYVPNSGDNTVSVVDIARCGARAASGCAQQAPVIHVGSLPLGVSVDEASDTVYVANALDNTVTVIDGARCRAGDASGCDSAKGTVRVGPLRQRTRGGPDHAHGVRDRPGRSPGDRDRDRRE